MQVPINNGIDTPSAISPAERLGRVRSTPTADHRRRTPAGRGRRGTVLLMVVGLLAALFIIISAYITLARFSRVTHLQVQHGRTVEKVTDSVIELVYAHMRQQLAGPTGEVFGDDAVKSAEYAHEDIPGWGGSKYQASLEPVVDYELPLPAQPRPPPQTGNYPPEPGWLPNAERQVANLRFPALSAAGAKYGSSTAYEDAAPNWKSPLIWQLVATQGFGRSPGPQRLFMPPRQPFIDESWAQLARQPFLDADGDGIPDSSFEHTIELQELANAAAGNSVRAPRTEIGELTPLPEPPDDANVDWDDQWKRFDKFARYVVALRVINHGGMVALDSAQPGPPFTTGVPWNRKFVRDMFNWVRHPNDPTLAPAGSALENALMQAVDEARTSVEPILRRRGGMLASWRDSTDANPIDTIRAPKLIRDLESPTVFNFRNTFASPYVRPAGANPAEVAQRFNSSVAEERGGDEATRPVGWIDALAPNPVTFATTPGVARAYDRRHLLTTTSHSDDLARKQDIPDPNAATPINEAAPDSVGLAVHQGQTKFYLGDIAAVNASGVPVDRKAAFDRVGNTFFYDVNGEPDGLVLVQRLAGIFYNMLSGHTFPALGLDRPILGYGAPNYAPPGNLPAEYFNASLTRRMQANMLTVNLVAFAAPRIPGAVANSSYVDMVWYKDSFQDQYHSATPPGAAVQRAYVAYGPQPFISEVITHVLTDTDGDGSFQRPGDNPEVALGVELYNPNEPTADNPLEDAHALDLTRFAISLNGVDPNMVAQGPTSWLPLSLAMPNMDGRFPGRWFAALTIRSAPNRAKVFDNLPGVVDPGGRRNVLEVEPVLEDNTVMLWRRGVDTNVDPEIAPAGWFLVDEFTVDADEASFESTQTEWWTDEYRDCGTETYFGGTYSPQLTNPAVPVVRAARWGVVSNVTQESAGPAPDLRNLGTDLPAASATVGPTIALPTMNAWPGWIYPRGVTTDTDIRPSSFPTVGFMLFMARFAHTVELTTTSPPVIQARRPMPSILYDEWNVVGVKRMGALGYQPPNGYPLDFGHLPIFDNKQLTLQYQPNAQSYGYFADDLPGQPIRAGRVPWGQLVFDYFTTLNPDVADPRRIPGRINLNAASWYILTGLPVLGPMANGDLPFFNPSAPSMTAQASPAFWSGTAGILLSTAAGEPFRADHLFPVSNRSGPLEGAPGQWRLGTGLGLSVAAYRDRIQYIPPGTTGPLANYLDSFDRNDPNPAPPNNVFRPGAFYAALRREPPVSPSTPPFPRKTGLVSIGELANVQGFDSTSYTSGPMPMPIVPSPAVSRVLDDPSSLYFGDYVKAVSLLALLDTHYLTTRSNTLTTYLTVTDRENPQASVRSQVTIDRSNMLPRLVTYTAANPPPSGRNIGDPVLGPAEPPLYPLGRPVVVKGAATPEIIGQRQIGYFNAAYDD